MALLRFERVEKTFPNGVRALRDVSLDFHAGEVATVLGRSGAGKSTLLRCANGLETVTSGQVTVDGTPVGPSTLRQVRRQVGMVFQQFNLVPRLSVMANVLCGRLGERDWRTSLFFAFPKEDYDLAEEALEKVGLADRAWDRADRLSGGQQQRVAIARTLVQRPKVVLADEPVASLDPSVSETVMELLVESVRATGSALVMNLHQVETARRFSDRIIGIREGSVSFDVPASQLDEGLTAPLYAGAE